MAAPNIISSYDKNRLGINQFITVTFRCDRDISEFRARATRKGEPWGKDTGTLIAAFSYTPADTQRTFEIYDTHLTQGDGEYDIYLYAQSVEDGSWNDNCPLLTSNNEPVYDSNGQEVLCVRTSSTQGDYVSSYTGQQVDNFVEAVT